MSEEKKLTDEDIVKDIERSTGMPSYWKTIVLDLINRQKAKIERLTKDKDHIFKELKEVYKELEDCVEDEEQAVKDTAKEILQEGKYCLSKSLQEWIKERYGVEVE